MDGSAATEETPAQVEHQGGHMITSLQEELPFLICRFHLVKFRCSVDMRLLVNSVCVCV